MIIEQILVSKLWVFCYLLGDERSSEGILVDPAGDYKKIFQKIKEHKLTIKWVINTHGHFDHTSGNAYFLNKTNAKLLIHKADEIWLRGRISRLFTRVMGGRTSPEPDGYLEDGNELIIGDTIFKVIHTPGHSRGSICLYTSGHVFTGDTLFTEGIGRVDLKGGLYKQIMDSIYNKILALPDDTIIWPGHHYGRMPTSTVKEQKKMYF